MDRGFVTAIVRITYNFANNGPGNNRLLNRLQNIYYYGMTIADNTVIIGGSVYIRVVCVQTIFLSPLAYNNSRE
jgi:acetyltransferase-like isoleucine patch superfamily enzyme